VPDHYVLQHRLAGGDGPDGEAKYE